MTIRSLIVLLFMIPFLSCKKEVRELTNAQEYFVGKDVRINDIEILNDSVWIACGGIRGQEGYIFRTDDAGKSWQIFSTNNSRSVYCLAFKDSLHGFAGGDFLDLWRTEDGGKTWQFFWLEGQVPLNEEDRPAVRDFHFVNDSIWYFCGGENYYKGVIYRTGNAGLTWQYEFIENEFRAMDFDHQGNGAIGGHGAVRLVNQNELSSLSADFKDDFMTGIGFLQSPIIFGVSYKGNIYKSNDIGATWENLEIHESLKMGYAQWNSICTVGNQITAVGNYGEIAASNNQGNSWNHYLLDEKTHLLSVVHHGGKRFITGNDGRIWVF